jgi:hypothetical protein
MAKLVLDEDITAQDMWLELINRELERRERLSRCENDFEYFCHVYFGNTNRMLDITPQLHRELRELVTNKALEEWWFEDPIKHTRIQKKGLVVAAPRGHAKTMVLTFFLAIWWLLFKKKSFIILVGSSALAAAENVSDIREELENNDLIKQDFGDLSGANFGYKWSQSDIVACHTDPSTHRVTHTCRVVAKSPGARIRGIKHRGTRPDGIIIDDIESDEIVRNPDSIQKIADWVNGAAIPALEPRRADFIMIGTILHYDSVLSRMLSIRFKDVYVQRIYRAYWDEDGIRKYLWPERFTPEALEMERKRMGTLAFNAEYLNDPVDPETRIFRPEWIRWYRGDDITYAKGRWWYRDHPLQIYQAVDPSVKERDQDNSDYFAHVTIGVTEESDVTKRTIIVLWPYQDRLDFPTQVQEVIRQANNYKNTVEKIGIESVAYQVALRQQILLRELLPVYEIKHDRGKSDKKARITAMGVFFENSQVLLRAADDSEAGEPDLLLQTRVHFQFQELYDSLMRYPLIIHDDLLDVLEMAIGLAKRNRSFEDFNPYPVQEDRTSALGTVGDYEKHPGKAPFLDEFNNPVPPFLGQEQYFKRW